MNITVWITESGKPPITHQGSMRFVAICAEEALRNAAAENRSINCVIPSDTLPEPRQRLETYLRGVTRELRHAPSPEPEIGWKRRVQ